jgi:hypothetical protein
LVAAIELREVYWDIRRGLMQDYANQIAQMFVGWQIGIIDLPRLATIGRGCIRIDLLSGASSVDGRPCEPFSITDAVRRWLDDAIIRDELNPAQVQQVSISCMFDVAESQSVDTVERTVNLDCTVELTAESGSWSGSSRKSERWHKSDTGPWLIVDV